MPRNVFQILFLFFLQMTAGAAHADKLDDYIKAEMSKRHIPGLSVAVVQDGKPILLKGFGMANVELGVPAAENTVYELASVTKQFTATAIMLLVEDGKIGLDDKIRKTFPFLPAEWDAITVRQLLSHTSGIKNYTDVPDFGKDIRQDLPQSEVLKYVLEFPLDFPPGERWNYSNTGYFLLGMLIEKASGKSYNDFLTERIFKPLGMNATRLNDLRAVIPNRATGYVWDKTELRNGDYVSATQPFAAGALVSTIADMVKWDAALDTDKLLKPATRAQMWTPTQLPDGRTQEYGFGWQVTTVNGHRCVSHSGGIQGFSTNITRYPDGKLTVIVLTNLESGNADSLTKGIVEQVQPELLPSPPKPIADDDPKQTEKLKGVVEGAAKGEINAALFTEQAQKLLVPRIKESKEIFEKLGTLKSFTLIEKKDRDDGILRRYRAVFAQSAATFAFTLDRDGKINGALFQPE